MVAAPRRCVLILISLAARTRGRVTCTVGSIVMASTRARFNADIEGCAVAIVMVVLYHAGVPWVPGGYIGVDVFFVLSGYLITGIVAHGGVHRQTERAGLLRSPSDG